MRAWAISALVLLWMLGLGGAFFLAAGEPAVPHPLAAKGTSALSPTAAAPQETAPSETQDEPPVGPPKATIQMSLKDFKLVPDKVMGKAGTITFHLVNEGRYTHDFRVEGEGVDEKAPKVGQGRDREWKIDLKPGAYRISCPISNHNKRGMTGTLVVK
ncbi:MAG TPA: cupredoxin domain-containing protein [Gaiellaceae bacterium]|nr:cupredoxin domain-containing protein [Gaiellaceae bacterium]